MDKITHCPTINKPSDRIKINKHKGKRKPAVPDDLLLTKWNCDKCYRKGKCNELCPPMEWITQQVEIEPPKEYPPSNPDYERNPNDWPESPTTSEIIFTMFFFDQQTQTQIANKLYITQQYVSKVINNQKQILIENLRK